jgi:hypothetical protein
MANESGIMLSWEAADGITKSHLKHSHAIICDEINATRTRIAQTGITRDFELKEMGEYEALKIHFEQVLKYFGEEL